MLVDVVRLRSEGVRLAAEAVQAARPVRGHLRVWRWLDEGKAWEEGHRAGGYLTAAVLTPKPGMLGGPALIPDLSPAELRRIDGDGLLLVGLEHLGDGNQERLFQQAWWCRVVFP